jgi:hypothetical protein
LINSAQRLAAQLLGRFRFEVTILAGFLKPYIGVRSLSLGQVSCSRGLGKEFLHFLLNHIMVSI